MTSQQVPPLARAVFLDRDGTLNEERPFVHRVDELRLLPGAADGLLQMAALGFRLFITTNQSGVARGLFSEAQLQEFNAALCRQLAAQGVSIAGVYYCPFHPTAGHGRYRRDSPLRKPRPGMILQAAAEHALDLPRCVAIGDRISDVLAGQAAGCRTILLCGPVAGRDPPTCGAKPDFVAADLVQASQWMALHLHDAPHAQLAEQHL